MTVEIPVIRVNEFSLMIVGDSPLITNRFSDDSKQAMLDKQMKKPKGAGREARDPEAEFQASIYLTRDGKPGFPASGIKKSAVEACRYLDGVAMTWARGAFFVLGDILELEGAKSTSLVPEIHEAMTRINGKTPMLRYRALFDGWSIRFRVKHNPDVITKENIINMINNAGFYIGIGDWRPSCNGTFGMFHVATEADLNGR